MASTLYNYAVANVAYTAQDVTDATTGWSKRWYNINSKGRAVLAQLNARGRR